MKPFSFQIPRAAASVFSILTTLAIAAALGCCSQYACNAIPASRLPCELSGTSRSATAPIDFSLLRQSTPDTYRLGPGDVLGVYIQDVLPSETANIPTVQGTFQPNTVYYPAGGLTMIPALGVPIHVLNDGTLPLPLVAPVSVEGRTLDEVTDLIRRSFTREKQILQPGRDRIMLTLIKSRVARVLVIRDDTEGGTMVRTVRREEALLARRGSAAAVDLPAYENDVLHALLATGGLPGVDAENDVWIIHGTSDEFVPAAEQINAGETPDAVVQRMNGAKHMVRVPLRVIPGEPLSFTPQDIVLKTGDIVYVQTRQTEFFYTGGLLPGGQIPLPRDYDLDVLGAIALANGSTAGPAGQNAANVLNFRSGPGNIVPPTRVIILRTLPDGEQIKIRVDINKAVNNPKERIRILPGDVVMLHYKPHEVVSNTILNYMNFNFNVNAIIPD